VVPVQQSLPPRLGRFEVGAKIGGGGMATIYVGRGADKDELVALKVIRDELAHDENFSAMFVDEAKILARLSHPNVIHTLEYGVTGHHRFIAMELLSGRTYADLWDVLVGKGETMPLLLGAWICARVAEGLHSAHELVDDDGNPLGVIHRDVNPTNIFLTHSGTVKLIDFGLAKARVRMSKSADGIVKGKIPYLAPEQAKAAPIDRRIDVYALGTTLWESVTMKRLFKRDNDVATLRAIRDAHVPNPRDTDPDFPEALWKVIEKALKVDREERYPTAAAMQKDLDAFLGDAAGEQPKELARLLHDIFPEAEAQDTRWLRDAASVRAPKHTMPPPAPLATASSSLLEDVEEEIQNRESVRSEHVEAARREAREKRKREKKRRPPPPQKQKKKKRKKPRQVAEAQPLRDTREEASPKGRVWVSFAIVAAVVAILWFLFVNR